MDSPLIQIRDLQCDLAWRMLATHGAPVQAQPIRGAAVDPECVLILSSICAEYDARSAELALWFGAATHKSLSTTRATRIARDTRRSRRTRPGTLWRHGGTARTRRPEGMVQATRVASSNPMGNRLLPRSSGREDWWTKVSQSSAPRSWSIATQAANGNRGRRASRGPRHAPGRVALLGWKGRGLVNTSAVGSRYKLMASDSC